MNKHFTGGASVTPKQIQINLKIGGISQSRVYNPINHSINKLIIISKTLDQLASESISEIDFYVNQLIILFEPTNLNLLPSIGEYQMIHNMQILIIYITACVESFSEIQALQLLNHNRIAAELYSDIDKIDQDANIIDQTPEYKSIQSNSNDNNPHSLYKKLNRIFNQYVQIINLHREEIEKMCLVNINQLDQSLSI